MMMSCIVGPVDPAMSLSAWRLYVAPSSENAFSRVIGCPSQYIIVLASPGDDILFPEIVYDPNILLQNFADTLFHSKVSVYPALVIAVELYPLSVHFPMSGFSIEVGVCDSIRMRE